MNEPTTQAGRELAALHTLVPVIGLPGGHVTGYCRTDGADWPCRVVRSIPKIEAEARADRDAEVEAMNQDCGHPSSVSDRTCDLPRGHAAHSATRFHRFRRPDDRLAPRRRAGLTAMREPTLSLASRLLLADLAKYPYPDPAVERLVSEVAAQYVHDRDAEMAVLPSPEDLAQMFHEAYERLAPLFGYETRPDSAVTWENVPTKNRNLMVATAAAVRIALLQPEPID